MKFIYVLHPLIRLAYILAYAKLKFVSQLLWGIEIWPRHSFLTKAFIPLKSDLDLTAYVSNLDSLKAYLSFYSRYRKVFPFIGELNIYTAESISFIKENIVNGFELERDPLLMQRFKIDLNNPQYFSRENAAGYLLLSLITDLHKIKKDPVSRIKKWKYHFAHVNESVVKHGLKVKPLVLDENTIIFSVLTAIVNLSNPKSMEQAEILRAKIRLFLEFLPFAAQTPNFIDFARPLITNENADIGCYYIEYLAGYITQLPSFSREQCEILSAQIEFVVFRYLKQNYRQSEIATALDKINEFQNILNQINTQFSDGVGVTALRQASRVDEILKMRLQKNL